ncbi:MAG: SAM-dependent methyltransferase [Planctomycetota bacterium]|jgi:SAM-dependent methyltransferase
MLLKACRQRGIRATGIDAEGPNLEELRKAGFEVSEGSAYSLPFEDRSVDWLSLRHVPHHLEDPKRAFAELLRVAGRGLLLAEPHFDVSELSQAGAESLDIWEKRQHRRRGMVHDEVYDLGSLLEMMPAGYEEHFQVEAHCTLRLRNRDAGEFAGEAAELLTGLEPEHEEYVALKGLMRDLEQTGLSWNGSLLLVLTRR